MSRLRAIATVIVAAVGAGALAFAVRVQDHPAQDRHAPAKVVRPAAPKQPAPPWALDRCAAAAPASASPLDAIARAQASFAPARDGVLRGVSSDLNVIATWTDRRIWLSVDEGATWGRVLDAPGRVLAVHADQCGRVVAIRDGVLGTRLGAEPGDETWRALPAPVAGAFLGLDVRGAVVTITARAIAAKGIDRDDAPASLVSTTDRGATWSAVESIGDVAGATPVAGAVVVTPRACPIPSEAPCSEIHEGSRIERVASTITLVDDPDYSKRWMLAPGRACGAALACTAFEGDTLAPVEITNDPPAIAKIIAVSPSGFLAIPAAADQDLIAIGPGFTRTILGSAGFPAAGVDMLGNLYGLDGAALTRLDRSTGVHTLFEVPGTIAKPKPPVASEAATGACPGPTAIRKATLHNQLWLLPLAVIANDKLTDASGAIESHSDEILSTIDASRARAAGAPALPHDVWILGTGDTPACHGVVRGYYGATDDVSQDSIVGAIIAGCGADLSGITVVDAAPGACKVAQLESVETADLPPDLASEADFAVPLGDPRLAPSAYYVAYRVRIPDDGRGYAHLAVDDRADPLMEGDPEPYSSGWRWIPADGKTVERREVADDLSEAITALVYDASGPRFAIIDGDCRYTIAQIGDDGALTRRATRKLERRTCNREGNPPAAWLSPDANLYLQTM